MIRKEFNWSRESSFLSRLPQSACAASDPERHRRARRAARRVARRAAPSRPQGHARDLDQYAPSRPPFPPCAALTACASVDGRVPLRGHDGAHVGRAAGVELRVHVHVERHVRRALRRLARALPDQGPRDGERDRRVGEPRLRHHGQSIQSIPLTLSVYPSPSEGTVWVPSDF